MELYKTIDDTLTVPKGTVGYIRKANYKNKPELVKFYPLKGCPVRRAFVELSKLEPWKGIDNDY
jgi:hypothetical protein